MRRARLVVVKPEIVQFFEQYEQKVFTLVQLDNVLTEQRDVWQLPKSTTVSKFINFLLEEVDFKKQEFKFSSRTIVRYSWGEPKLYEIAMSLIRTAYLSHYSATYFHQLVPQNEMMNVYLNDEQTPKPKSKVQLVQERIDVAFKGPARVTNNQARWKDITFYLLSGKNTEMLGVIEVKVPDISVPIRVTSIERTLIDITVRPTYAGGVHAVLEAYRRAHGKVSAKKWPVCSRS